MKERERERERERESYSDSEREREGVRQIGSARPGSTGRGGLP